MKICIAGWYFNKEFLDVLSGLSYPVTIIANRDELPDGYDFDYYTRENRGLEYGAYDYYLKNVWEGEDVLFMHDDMTISPVVKNYELINPELIFKTIEKFEEDLVYIFKNEADRKFCRDIHGRAMFASGRFLKDLKEMNGGFPWDKNNDGHVLGPTPEYCKHYNWAVEELKSFWQVRQIGGCKVKSVILPAINYHIRGRA